MYCTNTNASAIQLYASTELVSVLDNYTDTSTTLMLVLE